MSKLRDAQRLMREFVAFGLQKKAYWIIPLAILFLLTIALVVASQAVAPFIYTLF
jgi:hypothetical protein